MEQGGDTHHGNGSERHGKKIGEYKMPKNMPFGTSTVHAT
jgi:hypothetical protein